MEIKIYWIPGESNPADYPSRLQLQEVMALEGEDAAILDLGEVPTGRLQNLLRPSDRLPMAVPPETFRVPSSHKAINKGARLALGQPSTLIYSLMAGWYSEGLGRDSHRQERLRRPAGQSSRSLLLKPSTQVTNHDAAFIKCVRDLKSGEGVELYFADEESRSRVKLKSYFFVLFGESRYGCPSLLSQILKGSEPTFAWRESVKPLRGKPSNSPNRDSNPNLPVLDSQAQHETNALANYSTESSNANAQQPHQGTREQRRLVFRFQGGRSKNPTRCTKRGVRGESGGLSASKSGALWPPSGGREGEMDVLNRGGRFSSPQEIAATIRVRVCVCGRDARSYPHAGGVSVTVYVVKPSAWEGFSELRRHCYLNHGEDDNHVHSTLIMADLDDDNDTHGCNDHRVWEMRGESMII
uniref:Uncharacterized protein n=1 Tax=Timema tahoe TaxID=61484 RepID=A0A7R9IJW0_9NEOP|nr:unnamed protein product [Timema tahoe]